LARNVSVDGVANIKISSEPDLLERAAEILLGMRRDERIRLVAQGLKGKSYGISLEKD